MKVSDRVLGHVRGLAGESAQIERLLLGYLFNYVATLNKYNAVKDYGENIDRHLMDLCTWWRAERVERDL